MMYVIYNNDGSIKYKLLNEFVEQGNNNVNELFVAIEGRENWTLYASFKLPNGNTTTVVSSTPTTEFIENIGTFTGRKILLSNAETLVAGALQMNIICLDENDAKLVAFNTYITVNETDIQLSDPILLTVQEYENLLSELKNKMEYPTKYIRVSELPTNPDLETIYILEGADDLNEVYMFNGKTEQWIPIGSNRINLGLYYTKEEGQAYEDEIDGKIENIQNELSSIASGSPKGVYATLSALQTTYPAGTSGIYVVLADGHWYYWNSANEEWTDGGLYLSSLPDDELDDTSSNSVKNRSATIGIEEVSKKVLNLVASNNLFDKEKNELTDGYYILYDGTLVSGNYFTTDYVFLKAGTYMFQPSWKMPTKERIIVAFYSLDKVFDSDIGVYSNTVDINNKQFTMLRDGYVRFSFEKSFIKYSNYGLKYYAPLIVKGSVLKFADDYYCVSKKQPQILENSKNLINLEEAENGYVYSDGAVNEEDTTYKSTGYIKLEKDKTYSIKGVCRFVWLKEVASETATYLQNQTDYQVTPTVDMYMRLSATKSNFEKLVVEENSTTPTNYIFPKYDLKNVIVKTSPLTKKCYVACGDSFTKGGYDGTEGLDPSVYTFQDGLYIGQQKTYPLFIGIRNNMYVINEAVGGSTMARWEGDSDTSSFSRVRYQNIPSDADYITLKFGINDENKNIPIGTIDSNDVYTFYGAWNTVMSYIIEHHPKAKIGIIISNGIYNQDYVNATRNIAEKYGIPYLDEQQDKKVPLLNRVYRTGVSATIRDFRNTTFRISATNTHPNVDAQEYESTFVENFLKSL